MVDATGVGIQSIKALHHDRNQHEQRHDNQHVDGLKEAREQRVPARAGMRGSDNPLREDDVDDEKQDHPRSDEDLRRNRDGYGGGSGRPHDPQHARRRSRHAEPELDPRHDELVSATPVQLENGHVCDGAEDEQHEEDGYDGDVEVNGGNPP